MSHDDYVLGRGLPDSTRLDAQHLLWAMHLSYVLHPDIPIREDMRIADVGCGSAGMTSIWLLDISRTLPRSTHLHGYDISDSLFPPRSSWPENLSLGLLDSREDPPESLVGQYDVVHLRMWSSNMRSGAKTVECLIRSVTRMLKPGGYIQWEEADLKRQVVQPESSTEYGEELIDVLQAFGIDYSRTADLGSKISWTKTLSASLQRENLSIIKEKQDVFQKFTTQLCTKTYLLAMKEILEGIKQTRNEKETAEQLAMRGEEALARLTSEYYKGLIYNWGPVSILGQLST
ncbi:hypothetical protein L249_6708 [Ophiocordyceps polyrhachis-furcata BCC 54312]|uniref:Methyltransferase domain-containing protein n=1 Tax=Ophiocordyceps polyrhachis-furcata BCC 54312 TaxID=1330021 RepID=A0A367LK74_9HYPO|nr:hypothetical protein L249_6708 [Ophiocordyceps polyrhachis-furcata BCC 54312]